MNISATGYLYCYTACLIYILSSVICGVIRWFHMCHPYDRNADYFYPGRKQALFFYSALLLQLPYLLWPDSPDTWTYVRVFGMLYYPVCFLCCFYVTSVENSIIKITKSLNFRFTVGLDCVWLCSGYYRWVRF